MSVHPFASMSINFGFLSTFFVKPRLLSDRFDIFPNQEQPQMEEESRKEAEEPSCRSFHHFWRVFQMVPRTFVFILVATNLVVDGSRWYKSYHRSFYFIYYYHTITIPLSYHRYFYFIHTSYPAHFWISWRFSPGVLWPNLTGDEDAGWNHALLMGFCMKSTIQLLGLTLLHISALGFFGVPGMSVLSCWML